MRAILRRAIASQCPKCGQGKLFSGYLALVEKCAACGQPWRKSDTGDGPAVFVIFIAGGIVGALALMTEMRFAPPVWLHMLLWIPLTLLLCAVLLRFGKALLVGVIYRNKAAEARSDAP
jgi:uncharacterized protein (DUF983 family)